MCVCPFKGQIMNTYCTKTKMGWLKWIDKTNTICQYQIERESENKRERESTWRYGYISSTKFHSFVKKRTCYAMIHHCLFVWLSWSQIMITIKSFGRLYPLAKIVWIGTRMHSVYPFWQNGTVIRSPAKQTYLKVKQNNCYLCT